MRQMYTVLFILLAVTASLTCAQAQVRFEFNQGGWGYNPGVTISVGDNQSCGTNYYPNQSRRVYRNNNRRVYRDQRAYYNNGRYCPPQNKAYWCAAHNEYCTHSAYQYNQPAYQGYNTQPYWCASHEEYCTH